MKFVKSAIILIVFAVFIIACNQTETTENNINTVVNNSNKNAAASPEASPAMDELALGQKHYKEQCARCHQEDGTGGEVIIEGRKMKPHNLASEHMKKEPDSEYIEYMVKGIPDDGMPSFKDKLSEDDMKAVVKYIREELQK